tara:strand:+ start:37476 stop:39596 length:2121 start_codon:yes stop_codon:yes gene_type:complete
VFDQFKQTYFEECEDRIQEAEEGLTVMLDGGADDGVVNQVFRAIHSIKGGAGAFGFDTIVGFAHQFETTLDLVREGALSPDREMCTLFLHANDIVADMLSREQNDEEIPSDLGQDVLAALEKIVAGSGAVVADPLASTDAGNFADIAGVKAWRIHFMPHKGLLKTGNEPLFLLRALQDLGELDVDVDLDHLPSFSDLTADHVEDCYLGWDITLHTEAPRDEIVEVFDFVEDLCDLTIEPFEEPVDVSQADVPVAPEVPLVAAAKPAKEPAAKKAVQATKSSGSASIRVDLERIDSLVNLVGEMVIAQSMLQEQVRWLPIEVGGKIGEGVENLARHMRDLQESVMAVRAQPIKSVFTRMPRIVREVSAICGKDIRITTSGEETEVDKTVLENLIDPLTHMIRNSVDHGVEKPADRVAAGKTSHGTIHLSARHKSGRIIIEIEDDGKGVNRDAVWAKALKQGIVTPEATLTPHEIDNLIFKPGFSTAESVSEVSGRGVGMDVVKRNVSDMGGRITVSSVPGEGCKMTLSLPLTLAVMDGMVVSVGSQRFVLPTVNIVESFQPNSDAISKLTEGVNIIQARGEYVRVIPLCDVFHIDDAILDINEALLILLEGDDGQRVAVMVDDVLGQQQVVIKSLETNFSAVDGISAATILGNGDVALILDVPGLSDMRAKIDLKQEVLNHALSKKEALDQGVAIEQEEGVCNECSD